MSNQIIHITALDCLQFKDERAKADVLQTFIETQQGNIFNLSNNYKTDEASILAEYDFRQKSWVAGRFVGESIFHHNDQQYKITIKPRFGETFLLRMLEQIYNIRITKSVSEQTKVEDWQHYIKKILAFIWVQKLANANIHGVPKIQINNEFKGQIIKGRLNIRKSILPFRASNEVVSISREKIIDNTIAQIIFQAFQIIKKDFLIGYGLNFPDAAQDAINHIKKEIKRIEYISESEYQNIKYKAIYLSWKPIVDFSWDIIKRKKRSLKQTQSKNGYGFFIDIAEVWEQYLRTILKRNLQPLGWHYKTEKNIAYKGFFFQREMIPDFVFEKNNQLLVYDAKYKRMNGIYGDIDRADFFQIHTYIQNFLNHYEVKSGGLLYPLLNDNIDFSKYKTSELLHDKGVKLNYVIDGIELSEEEYQKTDFNILENRFIDRIFKHINAL